MPICFCSHLCMGVEVPHGHTSSCHCREVGKHCLCSSGKEINLRQKSVLRKPTAICLGHLSKSSSRRASLAKNTSLLPLQARVIPMDVQPEMWADIRSWCLQTPPHPRRKWELTSWQWQVPVAGGALCWQPQVFSQGRCWLRGRSLPLLVVSLCSRSLP